MLLKKSMVCASYNCTYRPSHAAGTKTALGKGGGGGWEMKSVLFLRLASQLQAFTQRRVVQKVAAVQTEAGKKMWSLQKTFSTPKSYFIAHSK